MKKIFLFLFFLNISTTVFSDSKMELGLDIYNNKANPTSKVLILVNISLFDITKLKVSKFLILEIVL